MNALKRRRFRYECQRWSGALVASLALVLAAAGARAEYDCQCHVPDSEPYQCYCSYPGNDNGETAYSGADRDRKIKPFETIQMYFQCTNNGVDGGGVISTAIKHKGDDVTCAKDYCEQPVSVQCTNWNTSSHTIHVDRIECSAAYGCSTASAQQQGELLEEYDRLQSVLIGMQERACVPRAGDGLAVRRGR